MRYDRNIVPVLVIAVLLGTSGIYIGAHSSGSVPIYSSEMSTRNYSVEATLQNYTQSEPIEIIGDDNFSTSGFSGDGTWQSPYLLENVNITTETVTALRIINTTKPFVIRSSIIATQNDDLDFGVYFENVTNGALEDSKITGFSRNGLYFRYCWNIRVDGNLLTKCHSAIETWGVWNLTLFNNSIVGSRFYAGLLDMIHDSNIANNTLVGNNIGFGISGSSNVSVESNTIVNGLGGVHYGETRNLIVRWNFFANLTGSAVLSTSMIQGYSSPNEASFEFRISNRIENNDFNNCSRAFYSNIGYYTQFSNNTVNNCVIGVHLTWSAGNYIIDNTIRESGEYSIHCQDAHLNRIYGNTLVNSGVSNALDDEDGYNYWDDGESIGNTWDDYIGPEEYRIPGDSNSSDRWPSRYGPPYISITNTTQIIVGTLGVNVTWRAFDSDPGSYTVYQNGTLIASGAWNGSDIVMGLDGLEVGVYNLTATVTDLKGHSKASGILVEVLPIPLAYYLLIGGGVSGIVVIIVLVLWYRKRILLLSDRLPK